MPGTRVLRGALSRPSLSREISLVLIFKLIALVVLYQLFFDERPAVTPAVVVERVLDADPR